MSEEIRYKKVADRPPKYQVVLGGSDTGIRIKGWEQPGVWYIVKQARANDDETWCTGVLPSLRECKRFIQRKLRFSFYKPRCLFAVGT